MKVRAAGQHRQRLVRRIAAQSCTQIQRVAGWLQKPQIGAVGVIQRQIKTRMFYPYISDSSFMALCDTRESFDAVAENMPSWKVKYFHDVDKILEINVPVVNIGAFGRDGHMLTERVDMLQTFRNVPNISYEAIVSMLS